MTSECARCGDKISGDEIYRHRDEDLCEDCFMGAMQAPKTCDVTATQLAKKHRRAAGQAGTDGLLDIQKEIYNYIKDNGQVTRQQIIEDLKIADWELEKQIAVLRHCELVKGKKEGDRVYLVPFNH